MEETKNNYEEYSRFIEGIKLRCDEKTFISDIDYDHYKCKYYIVDGLHVYILGESDAVEIYNQPCSNYDPNQNATTKENPEIGLGLYETTLGEDIKSCNFFVKGKGDDKPYIQIVYYSHGTIDVDLDMYYMWPEPPYYEEEHSSEEDIDMVFARALNHYSEYPEAIGMIEKAQQFYSVMMNREKNEKYSGLEVLTDRQLEEILHKLQQDNQGKARKAAKSRRMYLLGQIREEQQRGRKLDEQIQEAEAEKDVIV